MRNVNSKEGENMLEKWIKQVEENKKEIQKLRTKDRLEIVSSIAKLHTAIVASLQGWVTWLRNPTVMNQLSEEELKETFEVFKKLAVDFLELDLKMSSSVLKKSSKGRKKKRKRKEGSKTYIT